MFQFFKKKSNFELYYSKLISQPVVKQCVHHKAFTAAYLFVISDYVLRSKRNEQKRQENAKQIFSLLENDYLSHSELEIFDRSVELFGQLVRREIAPRGDWCFYNGESNDPFYIIFLCYGDLIFAPIYIDDYKNSPIVIKGIDVCVTFVREFNKILGLTMEYINLLNS